LSYFYKTLAQYYNALFPARSPQLEFLSQHAGDPPARLIDVASGTGEYVSALGKRGYECLGVEIDYTMWQRGMQLHPEYAHRMFHGDMLELMDEVRGPAMLAFCIGNSLPHLADDAELATAIAQMWDITRPAGKVALQVVNFDRVLANAVDGEFQLPTLTVGDSESGGCTLERRYTNVSDQMLEFHATLTTPSGSYTSSLRLLTLTRERITEALPAGVRNEWCGDFSGKPWSGESPATICMIG